MKDDLFVNEIIEWINPTGENLWERIIWIDENYTIAFVLGASHFRKNITQSNDKSRLSVPIKKLICKIGMLPLSLTSMPKKDFQNQGQLVKFKR